LAVAISPDNRWVVTAGSADNTARLWDLSAKDPAANPIVLRGHDGPVWAVAISSDKRWLVTGSWDNTARLWLLQENDLINLARITVGRNFSADEWQLYFPGRSTARRFPTYRGQIRNAKKRSHTFFLTCPSLILRVITSFITRLLGRAGDPKKRPSNRFYDERNRNRAFAGFPAGGAFYAHAESGAAGPGILHGPDQ